MYKISNVFICNRFLNKKVKQVWKLFTVNVKVNNTTCDVWHKLTIRCNTQMKAHVLDYS